jgi:hypothetical protein
MLLSPDAPARLVGPYFRAPVISPIVCSSRSRLTGLVMIPSIPTAKHCSCSGCAVCAVSATIGMGRRLCYGRLLIIGKLLILHCG